MTMLMRKTLLLLGLLIALMARPQATYYPPLLGNTWETVELSDLGWCTEGLLPLHDFLQTSNSKAFIVLKDGRIAIEWYFGSFTQDSLWYWASAGKSLTAFLVGTAQQEGIVDIDLPSSTYLGAGWTSLTPEQEAAITVRHQLTMTTGLDDSGNLDCTDPECLTYLAPPGTRWSYHNAPYTLLDGVIVNTTNQTLNQYLFNTLTLTTGVSGAYLQVAYNNVFFSKARSMARFGLLCMDGGAWNGSPIMTDPDYFNAMVTPSQAFNEAYGYLWWLNGQDSYLFPGFQLEIPGPIMPDAPMEAFNAMGKNGQFINVVPSQGIVLVRMGELPGDPIFVPNIYNNQIWQYFNEVLCASTGSGEHAGMDAPILYPSPASDLLFLNAEPVSSGSLLLIAADGRRTQLPIKGRSVEVGHLALGMYQAILELTDGTLHSQRLLIAR